MKQVIEGKTVPFDEEHVKEYLDRCIRFWRKKKREEIELGSYIVEPIASYYIDAFQSVRISLFGELLEKED